MDLKSGNCGACGEEFMSNELVSISLSGFDEVKICLTCKHKNPEEHYKTAAVILKDITKITQQKMSPEERLRKIKDLLR